MCKLKGETLVSAKVASYGRFFQCHQLWKTPTQNTINTSSTVLNSSSKRLKSLKLGISQTLMMLATATRPRQQASKSSHLSWEDNIPRFRGLKTQSLVSKRPSSKEPSVPRLYLRVKRQFLFLFATKSVQIQLGIWNKKSSKSKGFDQFFSSGEIAHH